MRERITIVPINRDDAFAYVDAHHRHHGRPQGYKYALAAAAGDRLVGVAIVGRPVARHLQDGWTVEVVRVCTDATANACSALYGACWRAARALGYTRAITYTQDGESGSSLRAAGWLIAASLDPRTGWDMPGRRRLDIGSGGVARIRWEIRTADDLRDEHGRTLRTVPKADLATGDDGQLLLEVA
jgi:hypothetical protein